MNGWAVLVVVCVAGGVGGLIHDLLACHCGLRKWRRRLTVPSTVAAGVVAAAISWGLYGTGSATAEMGQPSSLTRAVLASAVLAGLGGVRWLNTEVAMRSQHDNPSSADEGSQGSVRKMHQRGHAS